MKQDVALRGAVLLAFLSGCYDPAVPADYIQGSGVDQPPTDDFARTTTTTATQTATSDPCDGEMLAAETTLRFRVRTSSVGGKFAPRNVGAIWIQDGEGAFVKTLERWGTTRAKWLLTFNAASGGNVVDAITGATKVSHETHEVRWNLTNAAGCPVPAGDYAIWLELTDRSGAGVTLDIPIGVPAPPSQVQPEDTPNFHDMSVDWE